MSRVDYNIFLLKSRKLGLVLVLNLLAYDKLNCSVCNSATIWLDMFRAAYDAWHRVCQ